MKQIIYITEILTDVYGGIYTQTVYYNDGSIEEFKVPKGPIIIPNFIPHDFEFKLPKKKSLLNRLLDLLF